MIRPATAQRACVAWRTHPTIRTGGNATPRPRPRSCCGTRYLHKGTCPLKRKERT